MTVTVRVPGKVNLHLGVGDLRPDGYHELVNVFHAVSLYDDVVAAPAEDITLIVEPARRPAGPAGPGEGAAGSAGDADVVPTGADNLAVRAAAALAAHVGRAPGVALRLRKRIPVAAGMAGGSADAAGALVACDALWGTRLPRRELHGLARELGADVPFALAGGTAIGSGRGDQVSPVLASGRFHWVLAISAGGLPTPDVYAECDRLRRSADPSPPADPGVLLAALRAGDPGALAAALVNDLQPAAVSLRPALGSVLDAGRHAGALGAVVSGSGPTCAFLARSERAALDLAVELTTTGLCRDVKRVTGPVPGARVAPPGDGEGPGA